MANVSDGVALREGKSASEIFYEVLTRVAEKYPAWSDLSWPTQVEFRKDYVNFLPKFEARRLASSQRVDIANSLAADILDYLVLGEAPLAVALEQAAKPLPLKSIVGKSTTRWSPDFESEGRRWSDFSGLGTELYNDRFISSAAAASMAWLQDNLLDNGELDLSGRKVCVLGAGAEMASTKQLLQAGADVLWLDLMPPPKAYLDCEAFSGTLTYPETGADLLNDPVSVLATIESFADTNPVEICLYAYAPGQARELRLTGVMNALVNALPFELVRNVTMLVSPTTPTGLGPDDLAQMQTRLETRPGWEAALAAVGLLGRGQGAEQFATGAAIRSVVGIQGASYQAAQYLCKLIMAEAWSHGGGIKGPFRVSANTAAITQTRSLVHPVFDAAFGGAAALQVKTFTPEQSQCLNGLLAISDWSQDAPPTPGSVRVHGGIHTLPYPLEAALKPAAGIGFARSPGLLVGLLRGSK